MNKNIHRFCLAPLDTVSYANKILALFVLIANLGGWVPLFLENWSFQVGIDTKLGGGGVYYFQISKSQVFGPWVGILDPDPPWLYISFRNARNLRSHLIRAKLYPVERNIGTRKCGNVRCGDCDNIEVSDSFTSNVTGEEFRINHRFTCNDNCLIYGMQYVEVTCSDKFRLR